MADWMDIEQERQAETLQRQINKVVNRPVKVSASFCEDCDEPIPEARRAAVMGVDKCAGCQDIAERAGKHFGVNKS